jgi:hypothetical protein
MNDASPPLDFLGDDELGYVRSRTRFSDGAGLALDESYRLTHLPLVAPDHPRIIAADAKSGYAMGRHPLTYSLVVPVPGAALQQSPAYRELDAELRRMPFAHKIAWDILPLRRDKLHATICARLSIGEPPHIADSIRRELSRIGTIELELRGLFSGNHNVGRLYFRLYPPRNGDANIIKLIQRRCGHRETDLYLAGIYNFTDDLDAREAFALKAIIDAWWERPLLRYRVDHLWVTATMDTLVLDGGIAESVSLV